MYMYTNCVKYCVQSKEWVISFLSLSSLRAQEKICDTVHHILAKHVPSQMRSVNDFQDNVSIHVCTPHVLCLMYLNLALEKNNDDARRNYRSSNNIDGAKDI